VSRHDSGGDDRDDAGDGTAPRSDTETPKSETSETSETSSEAPKSVERPRVGTRLSAAEIHDNILGPAKDEMERTTAALLWSALASGLTIGFSFLVGGYAETLVPARFATAAAGAAYPIGFVFVVLARSELFSENTLEPVIPLLHQRDMETLIKTLRLWGLLLAGNLVGAALFAWVVCRTPVIAGADLHAHLASLAVQSTSDGFGLTLVRAIMAGWLIALMTWLLASTHESITHIILVWLTTAPISWLEFRHSIVGAVEAFYRVSAGSASLGAMLGQFVAPAVIGNVIGGVVLVAVLNYGQVRAERDGSGKGDADDGDAHAEGGDGTPRSGNQRALRD
jgi:formate/nitrite transporter FocA (FNT family)